jgi:hypothetical protein
VLLLATRDDSAPVLLLATRARRLIPVLLLTRARRLIPVLLLATRARRRIPVLLLATRARWLIPVLLLTRDDSAFPCCCSPPAPARAFPYCRSPLAPDRASPCCCSHATTAHPRAAAHTRRQRIPVLLLTHDDRELTPINAAARDPTAHSTPPPPLPWQVDFVPFPITGYTTNGFYGVASQMFALFFTIALMYPVSRLIRGLVMEKEMKIREGERLEGGGAVGGPRCVDAFAAVPLPPPVLPPPPPPAYATQACA